MRITKLIEQLKHLRGEYGDIDVCLDSRRDLDIASTYYVGEGEQLAFVSLYNINIAKLKHDTKKELGHSMQRYFGHVFIDDLKHYLKYVRKDKKVK